jgi:hypothetical protein
LALRARNTTSASSFATPGKKWATVFVGVDRYPNILGTQTREFVDAALGHDAAVSTNNVIPSIEAMMPKIHRSFAWVILIATSFLYYLRKKHQAAVPGFGALIFAIGLEWTVGVVLYFLGLPKAMQPVHLVLSIGILASISYPLFLSFRKP